MRIRDPKTGMYVCEIRGVCFVTWVNEQDRSNALFVGHEGRKSPEDYLKLVENLTGLQLELVKPW